MIRTVLMSLIVSVSLTACGSVCSRAESVFARLEDKAAPCNRDREIAGQFSRSQCEGGLEQCSGLDVEQYNVYLDCLESLPECIAGQDATWVEAKLRCQAPLGAVSNACRAAID